ncbi:hypothetical protein HC031_04605 [Planosporangium thailandense]|uniref:Dynamin family protein n=1 Tax=Planosporangium thailandense TaxID=765197 RepID=A0ABX0XUP3_9ACTN|nr:GTPase [Planosporangium thailandense]NJC69009.1 hypothetical protein [Planosporangium thailandense]
MSAGARLDESVWDLLHRALHLYRDDPRAAGLLHHQLGRFDRPLRVAVAGPARSGKSTLVNAIVGEQVAPIEADDGGQLFIWYADAPEPGVAAYAPDGSTQQLTVTRSAAGIRVELGGWRSGQVDDVVVSWPTRVLRQMTLIDTPAFAAAREDGRPSTADRILRDADAVLYLTRDVRAGDLEFLHAAQEGAVAGAAPVNVILVLARADEIGGGRMDALLSARQGARRRYRDPELNSLCMGVVALDGLVASAGRALTEPDFAALAALAGMARPELDRLLLSADRFVGGQSPAPVDADTRRTLLDRLGMFGVRLATTLIRTGWNTRAKLAAELVTRSGLAELKESVGRYFIDRADVLRARSALVVLDSVLRRYARPGSRELLTWVEYVLANTHDFRELRLLATLRDPELGFDADLASEAERLAGGHGVELTTRLGVDPDAGAAELWGLSSQALHRWQNQAEDPLLSLRQRRAAGVVVRSCESMLAQLSAR